MSALNIYETPPPGLFDRSASALEEFLGGPALIKIEGADPSVLFVSVLLHGNETSGWQAVCEVLRHASRLLARKRGEESDLPFELSGGEVLALAAKDSSKSYCAKIKEVCCFSPIAVHHACHHK